VIGVLYADRLHYAFADPAAVLFLQGISEAAEEDDLGLLLVSGASRSRDEGGTEAVGEAAVDGFVVYSMPDDDPLVEAALSRRLPAVLVDQVLRGEVPRVGIDDEGAARAAAEHVLALGHRRVSVVSLEFAPGTPGGLTDLERAGAAAYRVTRSRLAGYRAALEAVGLPPSDVPTYECAEAVWDEGRVAAHALLALDPRPTAILAMSDMLALGAIEAARERGLSVPDNLSVVGFDDVPEAARSAPPLTTVHQPHVEKGLRAGRMLVARLNGEEPEPEAILPTRLVARGSTAPPNRS
jgi:DNA-binding LacI/PurR family transcriptional regulator